MVVLNIILLSAVICFAAFAQGGEHGGWQVSYSDRYEICIKNAGGVTAQMIVCIDEEIDKNLSEIYSRLASAKEDASIAELWTALKTSQAAWDEYVNVKCEPYEELGGQRGALLMRNCMLEEVLYRGVFVRALLMDAQI